LNEDPETDRPIQHVLTKTLSTLRHHGLELIVDGMELTEIVKCVRILPQAYRIWIRVQSGNYGEVIPMVIERSRTRTTKKVVQNRT
jgi:hypothetical protein